MSRIYAAFSVLNRIFNTIGSAQHLREHGIDVVVDLPGVGQNYQDHVLAPADAVLKNPISLMGQDQGWRTLSNGFQ
ncbi:GMC family oxidoreductase N-terminal domain-containing protein [Pseudomonas sp. PDM09]|nr:GMC family oxidoreductase N-terminal domain-containing protein [Pseudomonas sp. PDM09]